MALATLDAMADGGIHDQLGGGFHRYTVDGSWLVPHFEKMLYDNALLARAYAIGYVVTGRRAVRDVARDVLAYLDREMALDGGGLASAQDADTDGHEGLTFVWTPAEVRAALGDDELAERVCAWYGITEAGNFEGSNVLSLVVGRRAARPGSRRRGATLLAARDRRPQPARDDKALAAWNGMALAAFADAGRLLGEPAYVERARELARFLLGSLSDGRPAAADVARRARQDRRVLRGLRRGRGRPAGAPPRHRRARLAGRGAAADAARRRAVRRRRRRLPADGARRRAARRPPARHRRQPGAERQLAAGRRAARDRAAARRARLGGAGARRAGDRRRRRRPGPAGVRARARRRSTLAVATPREIAIVGRSGRSAHGRAARRRRRPLRPARGGGDRRGGRPAVRRRAAARGTDDGRRSAGRVRLRAVRLPASGDGARGARARAGRHLTVRAPAATRRCGTLGP